VTIKLYAFRPVVTGKTPTKKTPQIESLLTYENTIRVSEVETGVIYKTWDLAAQETAKKNIELSKQPRG